jgi:hypothetical protein
MKKSELEKAAKDIAKYEPLKELHEWQEVVGDCVIGDGLSYQCEIEAVCEDTFSNGFIVGAKYLLEKLQEELKNGCAYPELLFYFDEDLEK